MFIYAPKNTLVLYTGDNGTDNDHTRAQKDGLVIGQWYRVQKTIVHDFSTDVSLQGFPGQYNSVIFKDKICPRTMSEGVQDLVRTAMLFCWRVDAGEVRSKNTYAAFIQGLIMLGVVGDSHEL
jgi:hypothetical protein